MKLPGDCLVVRDVESEIVIASDDNLNFKFRLSQEIIEFLNFRGMSSLGEVTAVNEYITGRYVLYLSSFIMSVGYDYNSDSPSFTC